jgi:hypothetical protein
MSESKYIGDNLILRVEVDRIAETVSHMMMERNNELSSILKDEIRKLVSEGVIEGIVREQARSVLHSVVVSKVYQEAERFNVTGKELWDDVHDHVMAAIDKLVLR